MIDFFNDFFKADKPTNTFTIWLQNWADQLASEENKDKEYRYIKEVYKDGKRVSHDEKVVVNGEVIKDTTKKIDVKSDNNNKTCDDKCCGKKSSDDNVNLLRSEVAILKDEIRQLTDKLTKKEKEVSILKENLNNSEALRKEILSKFERMRDIFR